MDARPIGIFDSGVGGLTVLRSMLKDPQLCREDIIYCGDTANVPYGNKSREQLLGYAHDIIAFLTRQKVKGIVAACGTHSSVTLPIISEHCAIPLLGVIKAAAVTAANASSKGKIGVISTLATAKSQAYTKALLELNPAFEVYEQSCPRLVDLVEAGNLSGEDVEKAVREYVEPLLQNGTDTIILGCTHYPFLTPVIKEYVGDAVKIVDPALQTVAELKDILRQGDLFNSPDTQGEYRFYVSGDDDSFYKVGSLLLGDIITSVQRIDWKTWTKAGAKT